MKLGPYELDQIYTGDARILARDIPDESVDLIFTDPIYDRIDDYRWLAEMAARVLKQNGTLLVWSNGKWHYLNTKWIDDTCNLVYQWMFDVTISNVSAPMNGKIIAKTNRLIWFTKGNQRNMRTYLPDGYYNIGGQWAGIPPGVHQWGKSAIFTIHCLNCFTDMGAIVFDPFTGGGTVPAVCKILGRHYLAFEIEPDTAKLAQQRIAMTQPPLLIPQPEQMAIEVMA